MRKWLEWTPLGSLYTFSDWLSALSHPVARYGALLGLACLGLLVAVDRPQFEEPGVAVVSSALLGTIWAIWIYIGWLNGYRRAILGNALVFTTLFLLDDGMPLAQRLLYGVAFGGLVGAIFPLAFLRLRSRGDRWWALRRLALQLPAPQYPEWEDSGATLMADCEPHEARALMASLWQIQNPTDHATTLNKVLREGPSDTRAWQLAQAVQLVRWGLCAGYLGRAAACRQADNIARLALQEFTSWDDFARSYLQATQNQQAIDTARRSAWKKPFPRG